MSDQQPMIPSHTARPKLPLLGDTGGAADTHQHPNRDTYDLETRGTLRPGLTDRTIAALRERFAGWGHHPSPENWRALRAIAATIEAMADGKATDATYLSSAPVGAGKTETICEALVQLVADPRYEGVGCIVFLAQVDHVKDLAEKLLARGISQEDIAIEIGMREEKNNEIRALGRGYYRIISKGKREGQLKWESEHREARVIVSTQAMLLNMVRMGWLHDYERIWHYQEKPRAVRIWDEAILPAEAAVATEDSIEAFIRDLRARGHTDAADRVEAWFQEVIRTRGAIEVPDFMLAAFDDDDERLPADTPTARMLAIPGREVRVRDDYDGKRALHYDELLPKNFAPLLVCDASGGLRAMYRAWEEHRGGLVPLPSGGKTYEGLTIHHWDHPAGMAAHRNVEKLKEMALGAANVLTQVPDDEPVLFVVRKPQKPFQDMRKYIAAVAQSLGIPRKRLAFTTWGRHMATNEFADIKHVCLVGVLQPSVSVIEALLRGAGRMPADQDLTDKQIEAARLGEAAHQIFQAAGRGMLRKMEGGDCPPGCTLWAIYCTDKSSQMTFPRNLLSQCFPGAKIKGWRPTGAKLRSFKLKSKAREAIAEHLLKTMQERDGEPWDFTVYDLAAFCKAHAAGAHLKHSEVREWLADRGMALEGPRKAKMDRGGSWASVAVYRLTRAQERRG